jgi:uncharacterized protein involved in exopolysaccharide biosynthesis
MAKSAAKEYSATAVLLFQSSDMDQTLFGHHVTQLEIQATPALNAAALGLPELSTRVARALRVRPTLVSSEISIGSVAGSDVLTVVARDRRPAFAAQLANTYAAQYLAARQAIDLAQLARARRRVTSQLKAISPGEANSRAARGLRYLEGMLEFVVGRQFGNAQVVQRASRPSTPNPPGVLRAAVIGLVLGLGLGCVVVVGLERHSRSGRGERRPSHGKVALGKSRPK